MSKLSKSRQEVCQHQYSIKTTLTRCRVALGLGLELGQPTLSLLSLPHPPPLSCLQFVPVSYNLIGTTLCVTAAILGALALPGRQSRSARFSYLPNARVKYDEALSSYSGINQRWRWTEDKFRDLLPALTCKIMHELGGELITHSICLLFNYSLQLLIDA